MELRIAQRATLRELIDTRIKLFILGVDPETDNDPVVWIGDQNRTFPMIIHCKGNGSIATAVRKMTEDEVLGLRERDAEVLLSIPFADFEKQPGLLEEISVPDEGEEAA